MRIRSVFMLIILLSLSLATSKAVQSETKKVLPAQKEAAKATGQKGKDQLMVPDSSAPVFPDPGEMEKINKLREKNPEFFLTPEQHAQHMLQSQPVVNAMPGSADQQRAIYGVPTASTQSSGGGNKKIPPDVKDEDIKNMKKRASEVKELIESERVIKPKIRNIVSLPRAVPEIYLAHGYSTIITLPYAFTLEDVALGDMSLFNIEARGSHLVIFPTAPFKNTNMTIFSADGGVHQFILVENSNAAEADFRVVVMDAGELRSFTEVVTQAVQTGVFPAAGTAAGVYFEGRNASLKQGDFPVKRKIALSNPIANIYQIEGKYVPVREGDIDWYSHIGNETIVAVKGEWETYMRRISDGESLVIQ